jgi:hypothetical protein
MDSSMSADRLMTIVSDLIVEEWHPHLMAMDGRRYDHDGRMHVARATF